MKSRFCLLGFFGLIFLSACAESPYVIKEIPENFHKPYFPMTQSTIEPGDLLSVKFYYNPEMNQAVTVRQDGRISLPFLQGLEVAGLTPDELQKKLVEFYSKEFVNPEIMVNFESKVGSFVLVTGEVATPGPRPLATNTTVGQLLAASGVKEKTARLNSLILVRRDSPSSFKAYQLNADLADGPERDIYMAPGDILVVPRNIITKVGDFVQQYIRDLIPPNMGISMGWTYELNRPD
ncbi:MAG: polysaccharide biosynthesis/export family protein [Thermodesulfobacteriota bacterium]